MRKLLVASQKSGVGKTTSAINLAASAAMSGAKVLLLEADSMSTISEYLKLSEHPERQSLRDMGIDLPGTVCTNVVPNLDVFVPYDGGACSDDDLNHVLEMLADGALQEGYDSLIVSAPPFLGGQPAPFIRTCRELVLVMQAESMAYRTMPAFLHLIQRTADEQSTPIKMRGILLTLPEGETAGGQNERELRGRFGQKVLPQVIPYDEEVAKAEMFGNVLVHNSSMSPAALAYGEVVAHLELGEKTNRETARSAKSALVLAATAARINEAVNRPKPARASAAAPASRLPASSRPNAAGRNRGPRNNTRARPHSPAGRSQAPIANPGHAANSIPQQYQHVPASARARPSDSATNAFTQQSKAVWFVIIGIAMAFGVCIRLVSIPTNLAPIVVGAAVTVMMGVVLRYASAPVEEEGAAQIAAAGPGTGGSGIRAAVPRNARRN